MTDPARHILHVGLAKTGTTTLQRHAFPAISQLAGYSYNPTELVERLTAFRLFRDPADRRAFEALKDRHAPVFVSDETLATWLPQHFEAAADELLDLWGPRTTILISLRDPIDFQASLYAGSFRAGAYISPQAFFVSDEQYRPRLAHDGHWMNDVFNVDRFDLRRLVQNYQQRFDRVSVLTLQSQFDLRELARVFGLGEDQRLTLADALARAPRLNSRPAAWDIKAHQLYVRLTGQQMATPRLGSRLLAEARNPGASLSGANPTGRVWWLKLRALLYRVLPSAPYRLPGDIYCNADLTRKNREYLAELAAREHPAPSHSGK